MMKTNITFSKNQYQKMIEDGNQAFPDECCGGILGTQENGRKIVTHIIPIDNVSEENKKRRFMIRPKDYRNLEKLAKKENVSLLGFYQSHPKHPAIPSETDKVFAWPFLSYIIFSVFEDSIGDFFSYTFNPDQKEFELEDSQILNH